ncbi:MAG: hypothetical protein H7A34_09470 [bacterium]|nr:hypothetical protein [bacterium]
MKEVKIGDYVLGTVWSDGLTNDPWAVGFFAGTLQINGQTRYLLVNSQNKPIREAGYRRIQKISKQHGQWLITHGNAIENSGQSLFEIIRKKGDLNA